MRFVAVHAINPLPEVQRVLACRGFIAVALLHAGCRSRLDSAMRLVALVAEQS